MGGWVGCGIKGMGMGSSEAKSFLSPFTDDYFIIAGILCKSGICKS
jgi:hypothetical protein